MAATLLDLLDHAVLRFGDRHALGIRLDDGGTDHWTYRDLDRRARIAAWRLRALDLEPGDRILTWSPSMPELAATYYGAMYARLVFVPLDLRMSTDAVDVIARASGARHLVLGTGRDAPDPREAGLERFPTTSVAALCTEPAADDPLFPPDWEVRQAAWERPAPDDVFQLVFTSGTTGTPKGVVLTHDNVAASIESFHRIVPPMDHRIVSLLPLSHLLEQAVGLYYALDVGADILYVRSRNPRVIFDALRDHRVTSMIVVPQVLDLFWSAIAREVEKRGRTAAFDRLRSVARRLPLRLRPWLFRSIHQQLGGDFRLFLSSGAFLPPALQQAWEDLGVTVLQGYGATETGTGSCTTFDDHGPGTVGRVPDGIDMRIADDGEIQFRGRTVFGGYWHAPELTATSFTSDGWYRTGDLGRLDDRGRLILSGRIKDMIVLPNGFNVYPEDIENALRVAGLTEAIVVETRPGRIEAIVVEDADAEPADFRARGRCRDQGGQRPPRAEPADRRLADLAGGGLPANAHPEGPARSGSPLGRRRYPDAGPRRELRRRAPHCPVGAQDGTATPIPSVSRAVRHVRCGGIAGLARDPAVEHDGRPDDTDDVLGRQRGLHASRPAGQVVGLLASRGVGEVRVGQLVDDDIAAPGIVGEDDLVDGARGGRQRDGLRGPIRHRSVDQGEAPLTEDADEVAPGEEHGRAGRSTGSCRGPRRDLTRIGRPRTGRNEGRQGYERDEGPGPSRSGHPGGQSNDRPPIRCRCR